VAGRARGAAAVTAASLTLADRELHARLGIPLELLEAAGVSRVSHREAQDDCGVRYRSDHLEGVWYPARDPETGSIRGGRVRRDHPEMDPLGKPIAKYVGPPGRHYLYFPPDVSEFLADTSVTIALVEAEKSALTITAAAARAGRRLLAIGFGGCWGWRGVIGKTTDEHGVRVDEKGPLPDLDRITWTNRDTIICFDANAATNPNVQAARRALSTELTSRGASIRIAELPVDDGVNGPDDYIGKHGDAGFFAILDTAKPAHRSRHVHGGGDEDGGGDDPPPKESQATLLLRLARDTDAEFFRDDDLAYVTVPKGNHHETYPLRSRIGRAWLQGLFMDATDKCPGAQAVADASNGLEALALRGAARKVFVRIAATANAIYLDLGDPSWQAIEIRADGWRITSSLPVRFRRPKGLLPLPVPRTGGSLEQLRPYVNVSNDDDFMLLTMVMIAMLRGRGPYPVLVVNGEQGSAKSTLTRVIKGVIDPNLAPLRSEPREPRDLMIAATNNHVLAFDNVSSLSPWLSDAYCRLSTGGGFSTRMLYENAEEQIFDAVRPVILNGIPEFATRPDLISRAVLIHSPRISETACRDQRSFWAAFEQDQPYILGALLDMAVAALAHEPDVQLERKPRMADFAVWAVAAEPAAGWSAGRFLEVYAGNRQQAAEATLDGDPVADLVRVLTKTTGWTGTATDLFIELNQRTPESTQRRPDWFKKPRQLSDALRRLAPALRQVGVDVYFAKAGHDRKRIIRLEQIGATAPASSASSARPNSIDETCGRRAAQPSSSSSADSSADSTNVYRSLDAADAADAVLPFRSNHQDNDDGAKGEDTWGDPVANIQADEELV
jgi:hypothetical protein